MSNTMLLIQIILPMIALIFLVIGIKAKHNLALSVTFWLTFIALVFTYKLSGASIYGTYFNTVNATIFSATLFILLVDLLYFSSLRPIKSFSIRVFNSLSKAFLLTAVLVLLTNSWINAYFLQTRMTGTPIMEAANLHLIDNCSSKTVFYKINKDGNVSYLCPYAYGLFPKITKINIIPEFITPQLSRQSLIDILVQQQKEKDKKSK